MKITTRLFFQFIAVSIFYGICSFSNSQQQTDAAATPLGQAFNEGEILYDFRCKVCHEPPTPGAPGRNEMGRMEADEIVEAMTKGEMKQLANNLTEHEMRLIAEFLSDNAQ